VWGISHLFPPSYMKLSRIRVLKMISRKALNLISSSLRDELHRYFPDVTAENPVCKTGQKSFHLWSSP
jgi:hypothetical protein